MKLRLLIFLLIVLSIRSTAQSSDWSPAGIPLYGREVLCLYTDTINNIFYATGQIIKAQSDFSSFYIARFDGASWDTLGGFNQTIYSLANFNGDLIASGAFTEIAGIPIYSIASYNGSSWQPLGNFDETVLWVKTIGSDLYAMGAFTNVDGVPVNGIAKWDGSSWSDVHSFFADTGSYIIRDIAIYNGNVYVAGNFSNTPGGLTHIAEYKAGTWQIVGGGIQGGWTSINKMLVYKNELYVAGIILKSEGNVGHMIQKWNDTSWTEVGSSVRDLSGGYGFCQIFDMKVHDNDLYIAGGFGYAGNIPAAEVARWDGSQWCSYGTTGLFTTGTGAGGCTSLEVYNDTLYLGLANDTLNGVHTNRCIKYLQGLTVDTCSIMYTEINEIANSNAIVLYPNPATNKITLEFNLSTTQNFTIEIKNILGQTVKKTNSLSRGNNIVEIDISELPKGLYFVQLQNSSKVFSAKFIKE